MTEKKTTAPVAFPIVGIGASAGGLAAFEAFFSGMPADRDPGMAFVLVQHLAPDHKSLLSDLIRRCTRMQVFEVEDGMKVEKNCTYIIPPNHDMTFSNGRLQLLDPMAPRGQRLPIDFFFNSLARDQQGRAICIILSGSGSDGTQGMRAIKAEGGMAMAQNPESTEYDSMPGSAIATGLVDYVLPPAEMPAQLIAYKAHAFDRGRRIDKPDEPKAEGSLKKIHAMLRSMSGHDFSEYKPNTIQRRIERRMAVHQIDSMDGYAAFLQNKPDEVEALFRDLLIGVTNFFRDPEAFQALAEEVIPKLFTGKSAGSNVRIWVPGCSTGEEAYSIAMLLREHLDDNRQTCTVQVFATDLDRQSIAVARSGIYSAGITANLTPERLARFFTQDPEKSTYRINKTIRDMLVFSEQDIIKDPPFSRMDLISCRNLLIYMGSDLQKKLMPLFHYALLPGGFLFLGTSETTGEFNTLFSALNRKWKLYKRKPDLPNTRRSSVGIPTLGKNPQESFGIKQSAPADIPEKPNFREVTEQALLQFAAPTGILINQKGDILYQHGRAGMFLEPAPGEPGVYNILKMAREGLHRELTIALHKSVQTGKKVCIPNLRVRTNGHFTRAVLTIFPIPGQPEAAAANKDLTARSPAMYLVILEESIPASGTRTIHPQQEPLPETESAAAIPMPDSSSPTPGSSTLMPDAAILIEELRTELRAKEAYLQATQEELETTGEELKSSNEEMQSVNEELQSTNEELETSKEELQSINEELATVNSELQTKVTDLSNANNDMNNLLAGTNIATVFVGPRMNILRFTPTARKIINLIQSDIGRPVSHIVTKLVGYDRFGADIQSVLDTLVPVEINVRTEDERSYTMRIQPYRTVENVVAGAVVTFVDITEMKRYWESLQVSETRYRKLFEAVKEGILVVDADTGTVSDVNPYLTILSGYARDYFVDRIFWDIEWLHAIAADSENFLRLREKSYYRYENLTMKTADGLPMSVEFVSNVHSAGAHRFMQCNIRRLGTEKV